MKKPLIHSTTFTFKLPKNELQQFKSITALENASMASILRDSIQAYLGENKAAHVKKLVHTPEVALQ